MQEYKVKRSQEGMRLDQFLQKKLPQFSRTKIQRLIYQKQILCTCAQDIKSSQIVRSDQVYSVISTKCKDEKEKKPYHEIKLDIVYEDEYIVVVNKPAGIVTHPGIGNVDKTLVNALVSHFGRQNLSGANSIRPGVVHRLDKDTSGFLLVAKNDEISAKLCQMIKDKEVVRKYIAIVHGQLLTRAKIQTFIKPHKKTKGTMQVSNTNGKLAITEYRALYYLQKENFTVAECKLETGRTHQIGVHMRHIGYPIVGDKVYGLKSKIDVLLPYHGLFAHKLQLEHPKTRKKLSFELKQDKIVDQFILRLDQVRALKQQQQQE